MPIIDLPAARHHLRLEPDYPEEQVLGSLEAAAGRAAQFLNRAIFATEADQATAMAQVPGKLQAASDAYDTARATAAVASAAVRDLLLDQAERSFCEARTAARETLAGIVATPEIRSAILLLLAHYFENRAAVAAGASVVVPMGAEYLLLPYRIGWGG